MHLIFKCETPVNSYGLTMAWSICYSAAVEMKLNKPKKHVQISKRVSTTDCNEVSNGYIKFSRDWQSAEVRFYVIITQEWLFEIQHIECIDINS